MGWNAFVPEMAEMQMTADARSPKNCDNGNSPGNDTKIADVIQANKVVLPLPRIAPDWSEKTLKLLSALTALQRAFVHWFATGLSAAESYRRASGRNGSLGWNARNNGFQLSQNAKVKAAIEAALRDRS